MLIPSRIREGLRALAGGLPRSFWVLWSGTLVNRMGAFVVPFLAIYLTQARGLSVVQTGSVLALYGAGSAIAGPVGGFLADHVGRRFTMLLALGLGGASMIGLGFAHRIEVIAPATFFVALISDMYRPGMQAALSDVVPPADRVRAFGLIYWVINLGFSIALAIAGLLATVSYLLLFVGDGLTSLLFAFIVFRGIPETRPALAPRITGAPQASLLGGFFAPYRDPVFMMFLGLSFVFCIMFLQFTLALPVDMTAHGVSKAAFGGIMALNGLIIVLVQPFLAPLLARRNHSHTLAAGVALVGIGFGLNAVARTVPVYALSVVIWTIGEIGVLPVAHAVVAELAPTAIRGRYQGGYSLQFGLAACTAPTLGSLVLQRWGATVLWYGCLGVGLIVSAGYVVLARTLTRACAERQLA